jgi:hypothetical protein
VKGMSYSDWSFDDMIVKVISLGKTIDPGEETNADHIC